MTGGIVDFLPAKSPRRADQAVLPLPQHCLETDEAARLIFRPDGRWGKAWIRFFRIPEHHAGRWLINLRVAALFHDLGKANADFVAMTRGTHGLTQYFRHEHLSALVLQLPVVNAWLAANAALDLGVLTGAVLSHHLKAGPSEPDKWCEPRRAGGLKVFLNHPDCARILARVAEVANLEPPPLLPGGTLDRTLPDTEWNTALGAGLRLAEEVRRGTGTGFGGKVATDPLRQSLLLATKAGLVVADSVASGLFRVDESISAWVEAVVHAPPLSPRDVDREILEPRAAELSAHSGRPFEWHRFQDLAAEQPSRALLLASCGSGKTLAAYRWAKSQLASRPLGRVIFLYPTRGTATEGFRDYVGHAPEDRAMLLHGSAAYELAGMQENPSDATAGKNYVDESAARLFALGLWNRRYFSATVDQFLAFMEHRYESLCLLPALADAAVIIDEVHSFDSGHVP
ncbi:MAG: hypothetical protein HY904_16275 [Deltaproteobacteria bacterium]|nr:hypothetical protein [Deltaproteobacteria bacterium]